MLSLTKGSETLIKVPLIKVNNGDGILKLYNLLFSAVVFNFRSTAEVELSRAEILKGERQTDRELPPAEVTKNVAYQARSLPLNVMP